MTSQHLNRWTLLIFIFAISALFLTMIREFIVTIVLSGIFSALVQPLYSLLTSWFRGRRHLASLTTVIIIMICILLPLMTLLGLIAAQAIKVGASVKPWLDAQLSTSTPFSSILQSMPFHEYIEPYKETILTKIGELVGIVSQHIIAKLSDITLGTVNVLFLGFILLYSMYFLIMDGQRILGTFLSFLPMEEEDKRRLLNQFTSVTRATIKGVAIIGIIQGTLAGLAFALAGIDGAAFWGAVMTVLSIIPGVGAPIVWIPAVIVLIVEGQPLAALGLALFCGLVVGSVDNLLRPRLVGKDTQLHELLILFGTLGGIYMFGLAGVIIGPIIAALFSTAWKIYGAALKIHPSENESSPSDVEK